jgi:hypothetical protein
MLGMLGCEEDGMGKEGKRGSEVEHEHCAIHHFVGIYLLVVMSEEAKLGWSRLDKLDGRVVCMV